MPLQNNFPVIDDRSYDTLVSEARSRIPRYTSEWTDLNETDPGMVLVELFAWLSEMQLFRLSKVPELNYLKFLELIGVELEPAKAATALVTFPMIKTFSKSSTIVPAKTQISTEKPDEQGNIVFETDKAMTVIRTELKNLVADNGFNFRDLTNDNSDSLISFQPFGPTAAENDSFMIGFSEEIPDDKIHLSVWTPIVSNNSDFSSTAISPCYSNLQTINTTSIIWEYWSGREWTSLTQLKDDSMAFTRSGEIQLQGPTTGLMVAESLANISEPLYWIRARINRSGYQQAPEIIAIRTNTIAVTQAQTTEYESVGGSNGEIDQIVRLKNSPVLAGSLTLHIDEGGGYQEWQEVSDFFGSGKDDPHYVLNQTTGEIRFSDGKNGRVPVANAKNRNNIRAVSYRSGGGKRGNLGAEKINKLLGSVNGIQANNVLNLFESASGADEESLNSAIKRVPQSLKSRERAVTAEDYQELALRSTNIARAKALPLYHPSYPGIDVPGVVTLIVIPDIDDPAPRPSEGTLQTVCAYLNERRLLTTELYVIGASYKEVIVRATMVATDTADLAEIKSTALESLELYFDPINGGEKSDPTIEVGELGRSGGGWPFGGDIYYSLLYRRLLFDGVKRIVSLEIEVDGEVYPECRDVPVNAGILLTSGIHEIEIDYEVGA